MRSRQVILAAGIIACLMGCVESTGTPEGTDMAPIPLEPRSTLTDERTPRSPHSGTEHVGVTDRVTIEVSD